MRTSTWNTYVPNSDNKYVQARCMAQSFTTDVTQWQGVDEKLTAGSNNLVESGGIYKELNGVTFESKNGNNISNNGYVSYSTGQLSGSGYYTTDFIKVTEGDRIKVKRYVSASVALISAYSSNSETDYIQNSSIAGNTTDGKDIYYTVPNGVSYVRFSCSSTYKTSFVAEIYSGYAINEKLKALTSIKLSISDYSNSGYLEYNTGEPSSHANYKYTDRISIGQGCFILLSAYASDAATALCFYKNGIYDKTISGYQGNRTWAIIVPEGVT